MYVWRIVVLSGADGEPVWERTWPGRLNVLTVDTFLGYAETYDATNVTLGVWPSAPGEPWSLVVNAYDWEERDLFALVTSRGEAIAPDGSTTFTRALVREPGVASLSPAGNAVGDATGDLLWQVESLTEVPGGCFFVCTRPWNTTLGSIDGATLATAWTRELSGPGSPYALPLGRDVDADGADDLLVTYSGVFTEPLDGTDGSYFWDAPLEGIAIPTEDLGGSPGDDIIIVTSVWNGWGYDDPVFDRRDGATGESLLVTAPTFASYVSSSTAWGVHADHDGDGVEDVLLIHLYMDAVGYRTEWRVESGRTGEAILVDDRAGVQAMALAGDLDADGLEDLARIGLDFFAPEGFAYRLGDARMPSGAESWARREAFPSLPGLYLRGGADLAGGAGEDLLLSVIRTVDGAPTTRIELLDGLSGTVVWAA